MEGAIILLLYEKLPNFCFRCGKIGHLLRFCEAPCNGDQELKFETWLMAPKAFEARKKVTQGVNTTTGASSKATHGEGDCSSSTRLSPARSGGSSLKGQETTDGVTLRQQVSLAITIGDPPPRPLPALAAPNPGSSPNAGEMMEEAQKATVVDLGGFGSDKKGVGELEDYDGEKKGVRWQGKEHKAGAFEGDGGMGNKGKRVAVVGAECRGKKGKNTRMGGWKRRAREDNTLRTGRGGRGGGAESGISPSSESVRRGGFGRRGSGREDDRREDVHDSLAGNDGSSGIPTLRRA